MYTTETKVYDRTGLNSETIQTLSGKSSAEVTTLIEGYINDAQGTIREDIEFPLKVRNERHLGDSGKNIFELGPEDDPYGNEGDYDPVDGLVEVYSLNFGSLRMKKPYPEDCELGTESEVGWIGTNVTLDSDTTNKISGNSSIILPFSDAGYAQYPDGITISYLDKNIYTYPFIFFYAKTSDNTIPITVRLYNKDGIYTEETISLRQSNVGQYIWLYLQSFDNAMDWNLNRLQYIRFYVTGACNLTIDNMCFADRWAFSAPAGFIHIAVADNMVDSPPQTGSVFYVNYGYDPFLASVPSNIAEAAEWQVGISIIDYLRGIRYRKTSFEVFGTTLELDEDQSREALMGVRTKMEKRYWECLRNWGPGSYGVV